MLSALEELRSATATTRPLLRTADHAHALVATKPMDFREGMDGLAALVKAHLGAGPFSGAVFVFRAKRAGGW
jgi:transposase